MPQQRPRMPQESPANDEPMIVLTPVRPAPAHLGSEAGR